MAIIPGAGDPVHRAAIQDSAQPTGPADACVVEIATHRHVEGAITGIGTVLRLDGERATVHVRAHPAAGRGRINPSGSPQAPA